MMVDRESEIVIVMAESCIVLSDRDHIGGSCIVLASDSGGGPRSRWQPMVDPDGGSGS